MELAINTRTSICRSPVRISRCSDDICNGFLREEKCHKDCSFDANVGPLACNKLSDLFQKLSRCNTDSKSVQTDISSNVDNDLQDMAHRKIEAVNRTNDKIECDNSREEISLRNAAHPCSEESWLNACTDIDEMLAVYDIDPTTDDFTVESDIDNHRKRESLLEEITPQTEHTATADRILETRVGLMENQVPNAVNMEVSTNAVNMAVSTSQSEILLKDVISKDVSDADDETHASPIKISEIPDSDLENVHPEENIVSLTDDMCVAPLSISIIQSKNYMKNISPHDNKIETKSECRLTQLQTDCLLENKAMLSLMLNDFAHVIPEPNIMDTDDTDVLHKPHENDFVPTQSDVLHTAHDKDAECDSEIVVYSGKTNKSHLQMNESEDHLDANASTCLDVRNKVTGMQILSIAKEDTNHCQITIQSKDKEKTNVLPTTNNSLSSKPRLIDHSAYGNATTAVDVGDMPRSNCASLTVGGLTVTDNSTQGSEQYMDMVEGTLPVDVHLKGTTDEIDDRIKESVAGKNESKCTTTECKVGIPYNLYI